MSIRKICLYGLLAVTILLFGQVAAWAGTGWTEPPIGGEFVGPELWAVVVIDCSQAGDPGTLRLKRVVDCNVETLAFAGNIGVSCPSNAQEAEQISLTLDLSSWSLPPAGATDTVITKVKNFRSDGDIVSFDAQIKFFMPNP